MRVLVTGATGRVGGQVAAQLAAFPDVRVKALTRHPAATVPGAETTTGDLTDPASLDLSGVDAVFLVFPSVQGDFAARDLIAALAPRPIVYLSAHGASPAGSPDGSIMGSHGYLESVIAEAGPHTFLRASGFAANTLAWAPQLRESDTLRWIFPRARRALVHEADLAAVAVRALTSDGHDGRAYHLTGPEQLTQEAQLATLGSVLGRSLRFEEVPPDRAASLFPAALAPSIVAGQSYLVDHPEPVTDEIARLTGRPAFSYEDWARDHAASFRRSRPTSSTVDGSVPDRQATV
jgi:uncharacterized protein YbjT (DUF2867 family)